ncbi:MAG TPA: amphi-Trp domain-containing protein [Mycobacterium sp.]|nr:amphi-Trp domain-containing protein [Mycobacterium sp.]
MVEVTIHKDERMMTRAEAAADLRRLADELEAGVISYSGGGSLPVPERLEREIEIEREDRGTTVKYEVEVELEWSTTEGGSA